MAKRLYMPILALLVGGALVGLLVYGVSTQSTSRTLDDALARHRTPLAPEAARLLPVLAAAQIRSGEASPALGSVPAASASLRSFRGRVVLLNFWASWCPPCQREAPLLERTQAKLARHSATVLGVTYEDATPDSQSFMRRYGLTYPSLRDVNGEFAHSYGTQALPESFLLDRRGRVVAIERGEVKASFLARAVALAERS